MADTKLSALTAKATPVAADILHILDSAASNVDKRTTAGALPISTATQTAIDTHAALTATHGATGAVVGTTNTQTLTNKSISASQVNSGVLAIGRLATGTPDGTKFVRDDGTLAVPSGGSGAAVSTLASLPAAGTAGRIYRLSDSTRELLVDTGTAWKRLSQRILDPMDFGAVGDGAPHALSTRYGSLGAAQVDYPAATATTEQIDWHAWNLCITIGKALFSLSGDATGTIIEPSPGVYMIDKPLLLPRSTVTFGVPTTLVRIRGRDRERTELRGMAGFASGRAVIEWEATTALAWGQGIENITITAPPVDTCKAIWYKVNAASHLTASNAQLAAERLQIDLRNIYIQAQNRYNAELIVIEGACWYSNIEKIEGDPTQTGVPATDVYDTRLLTFDYQVNGVNPGATTDEVGLAYSQVRDLKCGYRRGGFGVVIKGRILRCEVAETFANGARYPSVNYDLYNSEGNNWKNFGGEGRGETAMLRLTRGQWNNFVGFGFGSPIPQEARWAATTAYVLGDRRVSLNNMATNNLAFVVTTAGTSGGSEPTWPSSGTVADGSVVWTASNPSTGDGIVLVDSHYNEFRDRLCAISANPYSNYQNSQMLRLDNNSHDNRFINWGSRYPSSIASEVSLGSGARNFLQGVEVNGPTFFTTGTDPFAAAGGGSGDVVGPSSSVDAEIALFNSTTGKLIKRASLTGLVKATSGVASAATAGTDYYNPGGTDVAVADGGTGASTASAARTNLGLVIGTDVAAPVDPATTFGPIEDDFAGGGTNSDQIGTHGWNKFQGNFGYRAGEAGHPGIIRIGTTATNATQAIFYLGDDVTQMPILGSDFFDFVALVRLNTNDANTLIRVGYFGTTPLANPTVEGLYYEKLAADTNWFRVSRHSSTQTRADSTVAVTTTWVAFRVRRIDASNVGLRTATTLGGLTGATETVVTTNLPTGMGTFGLHILNSAAADKTVDIDYMKLTVVGMTR